MLLYYLDAAKAFLMKSDDVVVAEIPVEFLRYEIRRARLIRLYTKDDKVEVVGKCFDLGLIARLY
jgi:hypothetical protein